MAQLMPLPLAVSFFNEIQIGFVFLVLAVADPGSPEQRAVKRVCVIRYLSPPLLIFSFENRPALVSRPDVVTGN